MLFDAFKTDGIIYPNPHIRNVLLHSAKKMHVDVTNLDVIQENGIWIQMKSRHVASGHATNVKTFDQRTAIYDEMVT